MNQVILFSLEAPTMIPDELEKEARSSYPMLAITPGFEATVKSIKKMSDREVQMLFAIHNLHLQASKAKNV